MNRARLLLLAVVLSFVGCGDAFSPLSPSGEPLRARGGHPGADLAAWFARAAPEVLALPGTVFADHDEAGNRLVFAVERESAIPAVRSLLARQGVPASAYAVQVSEPIHFMSETLRTRHRPTLGGIQIHFSNFVCTLGFNVDHGAGRSFITNSHCTDQQGRASNTVYYQPLSSVDSSPIGVEAHDPAYFRGGGVCPPGRQCRYSDAARVSYESDTASERGAIARTTGVDNGDLNVVGTFTIASQDDANTSFSGTLQKVGRTTGWTQGTVSNSCVHVNVSGSNITLLCQTLVQGSAGMVAGGDSGSPVFRLAGNDSAELVGILWGGSGSGDLFVFSPLKNVQDELGAMTASATGEPPPPDNGGGGNDNGGGDGDCRPRGNSGNCR